MNHLLVTTFVANVATALNTFDSAVTSVVSEINTLNGRISGWSSSTGISGALSIQSEYPKLVSLTKALRSESASASGNDINTAQLEQLADAIVSLTRNMNDKAVDFDKVGAKAIGARDIQDLQQPAIDIISNIIAAVESDHEKLENMRPIAHRVSEAFNSANDIYGIKAAPFPTIPQPQTKRNTLAKRDSGSESSSISQNDETQALGGTTSDSFSQQAGAGGSLVVDSGLNDGATGQQVNALGQTIAASGQGVDADAQETKFRSGGASYDTNGHQGFSFPGVQSTYPVYDPKGGKVPPQESPYGSPQSTYPVYDPKGGKVPPQEAPYGSPQSTYPVYDPKGGKVPPQGSPYSEPQSTYPVYDPKGGKVPPQGYSYSEPYGYPAAGSSYGYVDPHQGQQGQHGSTLHNGGSGQWSYDPHTGAQTSNPAVGGEASSYQAPHGYVYPTSESHTGWAYYSPQAYTYYDSYGRPYYIDQMGNPYYVDQTGRAFYYDQKGYPHYMDPYGVQSSMDPYWETASPAAGNTNTRNQTTEPTQPRASLQTATAIPHGWPSPGGDSAGSASREPISGNASGEKPLPSATTPIPEQISARTFPTVTGSPGQGALLSQKPYAGPQVPSAAVPLSRSSFLRDTQFTATPGGAGDGKPANGGLMGGPSAAGANAPAPLPQYSVATKGRSPLSDLKPGAPSSMYAQDGNTAISGSKPGTPPIQLAQLVSTDAQQPPIMMCNGGATHSANYVLVGGLCIALAALQFV